MLAPSSRCSPLPRCLLDEPLDGLDPHEVRDAIALLRREAEEGRTLLLSIHQLTEAERICDRFVLLVDGAVRGQPSHPAPEPALR